MRFSDWEKREQYIQKQMLTPKSNAVTCKKCGSQWFEQIQVSQYNDDHHVIKGQQVPTLPTANTYFLLKCVTCQALEEPRILYGSRDLGTDDYDELLDTVEGKLDKRKELDNEVQAEKL